MIVFNFVIAANCIRAGADREAQRGDVERDEARRQNEFEKTYDDSLDDARDYVGGAWSKLRHDRKYEIRWEETDRSVEVAELEEERKRATEQQRRAQEQATARGVSDTTGSKCAARYLEA